MRTATSTDLAVTFFMLCNAIRFVAYFPQLFRVMRDRDGAAAISCTTWFMFSLAHASTVAYSILILHDNIMTVVFLANFACSSAILVATLLRRRLHHSSLGSTTIDQQQIRIV